MSVSEFVCIHHRYTRTGGGNLISGTFQWYTWHRVTYFSGGISQYKLVSVSVCVCHGLCFSSQLLQRCDNSPRCWLHVIPDRRIWLPLRYSKRESRAPGCVFPPHRRLPSAGEALEEDFIPSQTCVHISKNWHYFFTPRLSNSLTFPPSSDTPIPPSFLPRLRPTRHWLTDILPSHLNAATCTSGFCVVGRIDFRDLSSVYQQSIPPKHTPTTNRDWNSLSSTEPPLSLLLDFSRRDRS